MPTLLTRRDELFPLARQVVRESGYQYSKGHSRSQFSQTGFPSKLFGTNVNIAGTPGTPPGANGEREHPSPPTAKNEGKQPRKRQRISDNDFLQQKRRVRYKTRGCFFDAISTNRGFRFAETFSFEFFS